MAGEDQLPSNVYREASIPSNQSRAAMNEQSPMASGTKRSAAEPLEQSTTKVAKLTSRKDDETYSETEVKEEPNGRDEQVVQLHGTVKTALAKIKRLEKELEEAEKERDEYLCRKHELEAREARRMEKENIVETSKHAEMKLASKNLHAQLKADQQRKEKELEKAYRNKLDAQTEKINAKWEKHLSESRGKHQKAVASHKSEVKTLKEEHKEELKTIKENHKQESKQLKPEYSQAMKEKTNELKAKESKIARLEKSVQSMDALMAEKENLANEVEAEKSANEKLLRTLEKCQKAHEDIQGQYKSELEQAGQKWQIQHDLAENAKAQLMTRQRSSFALRGEMNNKIRKIEALEEQLQTALDQNEILTANAAVQTSIENNDNTTVETGTENIEGPDS